MGEQIESFSPQREEERRLCGEARRPALRASADAEERSQPFSPPEKIEHIRRTLEAAGVSAWYVGGCVRDWLRGVLPHDYDIAAAAPPERIAGALASPEFRVLPTGLRYGTQTVLYAGASAEVTSCRSEGAYRDGRRPEGVFFVGEITEDLSRRDFTIGAMAWRPEEGLIDPADGRGDLSRRLIRCVGDPDARFREDGLRLLRAMRFASCLGFSVEEETAGALLREKERLRAVSAERITAELVRLLGGASAGETLERFRPVVDLILPPGEGKRERSFLPISRLPADPVLRLAALVFLQGGECAARGLRLSRADRRRMERILRCICLAGRREAAAGILREGPDSVYDGAAVRCAFFPERGEDPEETRNFAEEALSRLPDKRALALSPRALRRAGCPKGPALGQTFFLLCVLVMTGECPNEPAALIAQAAEIFPAPSLDSGEKDVYNK